MIGAEFGNFLLSLAFLFALTYLFGGFLARLQIPGILAALIVAMVVRYTPIGSSLLEGENSQIFTALAHFGVLFLLFYIGLEIDIKRLKNYGGNILWLTGLNTIVPFIFGTLLMRFLGYGWALSLIIGLTCMPTAEAVVIPILDKFKLVKTKVGQYIIAAGTLDDVIEVFLIAVVSFWIGERTTHSSGSLATLFIGLIVFIFLAVLAHKLIIPFLSRFLERSTHILMMLTALVILSFGGVAQISGLGMLIGAVVAGILMQPVFGEFNHVGIDMTETIREICYGFLGPIFFFWIGLHVDFIGLFKNPYLAILLFMAATFGKLIGVLFMVPMNKLNIREAISIGVGLNARLTTEIIVAQILLQFKLIDLHLFSALVAAASLSTLLVPLIFSIIASVWNAYLTEKPKVKIVETAKAPLQFRH